MTTAPRCAFGTTLTLAFCGAVCACGDDSENPSNSGGTGGSAASSAAGAAGSTRGGSSGSGGSGARSATGGTTGAPADGAAGADAGTPDATAEADGPSGVDLDAGDAADAADAPEPISKYCGDSVRDPVTEECDDGPGTEADSCNDQCRVTGLLAAPLAPPSGVLRANRFLGLGRHPTAAGPRGYALALVDATATRPTDLRFSAFDAYGRPISTASGVAFATTTTSTPFTDSNPVLAALPDRTYAAAWTDLLIDGDQRGIALRRIDPASGPAETPIAVNQTKFVNQENPDIVWTGSELVVAWVDQASSTNRGDIHVRSYDQALTPKAEAAPLSATLADDFDVALTAFAGSYAAAWRSYQDSEVIEIRAGTTSWSVGPFASPNPDDRPALVALDASRLALVFALNAAPAGAPAEPRVAIAVLDVASPGVTESILLDVPPVVNGTVISQTQPVVGRSGAALYVAWRESSFPIEALWDDLWLKRVPYSLQNGAVVLDLVEAAVPLVKPDAYRDRDQRVPALVAGSMHGLLVAWNDYGQVLGTTEGLPDVMLRLERVPFANLSAE